MKADFKWNNPDVVNQSIGGRDGQLFMATTAARFMDPYVPAKNLVLAQNIRITADDEAGHVIYNSPYAHYQYMGVVYGPNIPIKDGDMVVGFWSPPHKTPTNRKLKYSTFRHPLATDHWDKAMVTARKDDLAKTFENYLRLRSNR